MHLSTLQILYIAESVALFSFSGGQFIAQYLPCCEPKYSYFNTLDLSPF
jgi:hypothetical protein